MIKIACVVCAAAIVAGCQSLNVFDLMNPKQQPRINQATFCDVMNARGGPIRWNPRDTRMTKEQADAINRAGIRLCGWGTKK
jgi:hypothetical protein